MKSFNTVIARARDLLAPADRAPQSDGDVRPTPEKRDPRHRLVRVLTTRRIAGGLLGLSAFFILTHAKLNLTVEQANLLGLLAMMVIFWVSRVLPMALTAILAMALAVLLQIAPADTVFGAFSSPTLFLLLGSFLLTEAMIKHRLAERLSLEMLLFHVIGGSTTRIIIAFGAVAAIMSAVLDNGAVAAILLPIAVGIARTFRDQLSVSTDAGRRGNFLCALLLMIAFGSTVGALLLPLGDASNLVAWDFMQEIAGTDITMGLWLAMATPISVVLFAVLCVIVIGTNRPEIHAVSGKRRTILPKLQALGPMSDAEKVTTWVFLGAIFFWLLPSFAAAGFGSGSEPHEFLLTRLPPSVVAILAACVLFLVPAGKERSILVWNDTKKMNLGPLFLVGATLAMGSLMAETGLATELSGRLARAAEGLNATGVYVFAATIAIMFSELTTNLVSVTVVVPFIPAIAESGGADPLTATWIATFAAIYGFMLPISTSANAIVYGSGQIPMWRMLRTGFLVDLSGILLVVGGVLLMVRLLGAG